MTDKALIEKAFREWCNKQPCQDCNEQEENWCRWVWKNAQQAGATWQREQLEAKILELEKQVEYYIQLKDFHLCDIKHLRAENKTIREQLIKELREWIKEHNTTCEGSEWIEIPLDDLLAKLDLLEGEK